MSELVRIYYWLFNRAPRNSLALWLWRKWAGMLTLAKHIRRRNWRQAAIWLRMVVPGRMGTVREDGFMERRVANRERKQTMTDDNTNPSSGVAAPSPGSENLDLCLTCGAEIAAELWGGKCQSGHEVVHQIACDKCNRLVGVITDDDYCGPEKLVCPDCMDALRTPNDPSATAHSGRQVIERKLLASKQDLEDLIAACEHNQFRHELRARCNDLAARIRQLLREAFQNEKG